MYGAYTGVLEHLVLQLQIGKNLKPQAILHFLQAFQFWPGLKPLMVHNPMTHHHHGQANEAERWEEYRQLGDPIGNIGRLGQAESHTTMRNPGFGGPLIDHDRKPSEVPSFVERDASSSEASMDYWMGNTSSHSSSSDWEMPEECAKLTRPSLAIILFCFKYSTGAEEK
jgi:hypothetical protein